MAGAGTEYSNFLQQCTSVCVLHLGYSGAVNDNSAPLLAGMTQLRILSLTGCINLGDAGAALSPGPYQSLNSPSPDPFRNSVPRGRCIPDLNASFWSVCSNVRLGSML